MTELDPLYSLYKLNNELLQPRVADCQTRCKADASTDTVQFV
jgi:hypothetical protein